MIEKHIKVGFFNDFKGEDSILISADIHGLLELESIFLMLTVKGKSFLLNQLETIDKNHKLPISLISGDIDKGLRKVEDYYEWNLTPEKWDEFRKKTSALYNNGTIGHQYLDSDSLDIFDLQVVLSLNEYNMDFWSKFDNKKQ